MNQLNLKPTHKLVKSYYEVLGQFGQLSIDHEMAVRSAFQSLLSGCGRQFDWTLVPEYAIKKPPARLIKVDGALLDAFKLTHGFWEAKDEHDDLEREIKHKLEQGYPRNNIIFQAPERAILIQNGVRQGLNEDICDGGNLVELLKVFFGYREPHHEEWEEAVADFKDHIPEIAKAVKQKIEEQHRDNKTFAERFQAFYDVCRQSINPNLSVEAVERMLVQHLLTERIFRRIFDNPDFTRRNVVAVEIEKVIDSMTAKQFSRDAFLKDLDRFYKAIEQAADNTEDYSEKQHFINTVYERFFQGYSPKEADTHGIVYTPQPIVDFMVRSVEDILQKEFGRSLSDKGVHILDPFVGTGNFITRVMKEIKKTALPHKYEHELHCNEVMLLPYYVASMNIEHEYMERTGEYKPFPGICLVDTFDMRPQGHMFAEENLDRIEHQRQSQVFVIISNPPYNAWQDVQNDNNKNRRYLKDGGVDTRVAETYSKESLATNKNALSDTYVKAFRWASDRIKDEGVVAFVSNNSFVDALAADGMRKTLRGEFDRIYVLDLGGNVRRNPKLSGTTHNVFGIQVGVCITLLIRHAGKRERRRCNIHYFSTDAFWTRTQKYNHLESTPSVTAVNWKNVEPDSKNNWLTSELDPTFDHLLCLGGEADSIFALHSRGVATCRDDWAFNFQRDVLSAHMRRSVDFYNAEILRWRRAGCPKDVDGYVTYDDSQISWSRDLKVDLTRERFAEFSESNICTATYRPFTRTQLYFDRIFNEEVYRLPAIFPLRPQSKNVALIVTAHSQIPFSAQICEYIPCLDVGGRPSQMFPFYTYNEDGSNRRENITDWALSGFRKHYNDASITKWNIFHYVYAVLHHPEYRLRYAANLKRELPRIPFVGASGGDTGPSIAAATNAASAQDDKTVFWAFVEAGRRLADLHLNYEQQKEYPLERIENPKEKLNWRVEKMRLGRDKTSLFYNDFLTLKGIPPETFEYRLGNRSALEWVVDQYQVSTDKRSGIVNDPNRADDLEYIVRLVGQVITVSLETVEIVKNLPQLEVFEHPTVS